MIHIIRGGSVSYSRHRMESSMFETCIGCLTNDLVGGSSHTKIESMAHYNSITVHNETSR